MALKKIKEVLQAKTINMGGNRIEQPFPTNNIDYIDPFLLIHHWKDTVKPNQHQRDVGVGIHPHRGFSPVTFIYEGDIHHRDSLGNSEVVAGGGTQWMFAGKGITHSERPSKQLAKNGGALELIQFWVNAPAKDKLKPAFYKPIHEKDTPTIEKDGLSIPVVCGEYEGVKGAVDYYSPLILLRPTIQAETTTTFELPATHNTLIYLLDGHIRINNEAIFAKEMVWLAPGGTTIEMTAKKDTRFIILSGEPLGEPVTSYGPFVMNNQTEIMEAIRDAQRGKMGILIEEF